MELYSVIDTWNGPKDASYLIKRQSYHHIETSQSISSTNQLTGFYMMATVAFNELIWYYQTV